MRFQPLRKSVPVGWSQHHAVMRHWNLVPVYGIFATPCRGAGRRIDPVGDYLVPEKIEIDPPVAAPAFGASKNLAVEMPRGREVVDRKGDMKGCKIGHPAFLTSSPVPRQSHPPDRPHGAPVDPDDYSRSRCFLKKMRTIDAVS